MKRIVPIALLAFLLLLVGCAQVGPQGTTSSRLPNLTTLPTPPTPPYASSTPAVPTDPTDPFVPTLPTMPTKPTVPTLPTIPTEPTIPVIPTEPTKPIVPTQPTEPTKPILPTQPTEPTKPIIPTQPTEPTEPTFPTQPTEPTEPTSPSQPTEPTKPTEPEKPEDAQIVIQYTPKVENNGVTYTGLPALPALECLLRDPLNARQLSVKRVDFAFGAASGGAPHWISVNNQKTFDDWGTGALCWDNQSQEKVLYLTFDCGYEYKNLTTEILDVLKDNQVPAAFFCTMSYLKSSPKVVARMIADGHIVGNHSLSHPSDCAALSREKMVLEALAVENHLRINFGYTSAYFRFPAGVYSENAVEALHSVGFRSVFWSIAYADWDPANQQEPEKAMQTLKNRLHPGAVILLHSTSDTNAAILDAFIDYAISQGYTFRSLDEYPDWK